MSTASTLLWIAEAWLIAGGAVAAAFLLVGIDRIDEDARGAYAFRPLIVPGILLLWPLVLWRWWVLETGRDRPEARYRPVREAHAVVAVVLGAVVLGTLVLAFSVRQEWPGHLEPERIQGAEEAAL